MRFQVPQFINYELKILGPLNLRQTLFLGITGAVIFVMRFFIPFQIFLPASLFLAVGALAFGFLKIEGRTLPIVLINFFMFSISPKLFLWKRKNVPPRLIRIKKVKKKEEVEEVVPLQIAGKSRLKNLSNQIEVGFKQYG